MAYDIIGDVHGQAGKLKKLLRRLGYAERNGAWRHSDPRRTAVFVGDYIDRGPEQVETIEIVRGMVGAGTARAIMGNHELNAIGFVTRVPGGASGEFFRKHTPENVHQHAEFLKQVREGSTRHKEYIDWFETLPAYLDLGGIRVVHAWWHPPHVAVSSSSGGGPGSPTSVSGNAYKRDTAALKAVKEMSKGLEVDLPAGYTYTDKDGVVRNNIRVKWWDAAVATYAQAVIGPANEIANVPAIALPEGVPIGFDSNVPVFIGHYWFKGVPAPLNDRLACVDYSAAIGDRPLVGYRWDGENVLGKSGFVGSD